MPRTPSPRPRPVIAGRLGGRHELGQNLLIDRRFPATMTEILRHAPPLPILELGAGNGAVTVALVEAGLPVTAVEIDPRAVAALRRQFPGRARSGGLDAGLVAAGHVTIVEADMLAYDHGPRAHHVVSNVPFGITTPVLRRLMPQRHWHTAVLLVQWEVARKRAGIGGTTLLTAGWWPWYDFSLAERVPAAAFRPVPAVDGGILVIRRRERPFLDTAEQSGYQQLVRLVFTGAGHGVGEILRAHFAKPIIQQWLREQGVSGRSLPRDLTAEHWVSLYGLHRPTRRR